MKNVFRIATVLMIITMISVASFAQAAIPAKSVQIRGIVLKKEKLQFPKVRLTLKIIQSSNNQMINPKGSRNTVKVYSNDSSSSVSHLLQGDEISAKLYTGKVRDSVWQVSGIKRIQPVKLNTEEESGMDSPLQLALAIGQSEYETGVPIKAVMTVTNTGKTAETLAFRSGQKFDLLVYKADKEIWRLSSGMMYTMMLTNQTLEPGASLRLEGVWRQTDNHGQQVEPGVYQMKGILTISGTDKPETALINIKIK